MTLMGGPIDTRINPTAVNKLAEEKRIDWFRDNVIMPVPWPQPGLHAHGLSGIPAALRLHEHEPRPSHHRAQGVLRRIWSRTTATARRSTASSTTNISPSWT
jgi:hypothetical protein